MSDTSSAAMTQQDNSIQRPQGKGWWRIICLLVILCVIAVAAYRYGGSGVHFDEEFASQTFHGMTTHYLNSSNHSNISILYLTEGADGRGITDRQWRQVNRIANETDAEIIVPDLAALSAGEEAIYESLYDWYVPWQYGNDSRLLYIVGDTADDDLVRGFLAYLEAHDAHLPDDTGIIDNITNMISTKE